MQIKRRNFLGSGATAAVAAPLVHLSGQGPVKVPTCPDIEGNPVTLPVADDFAAGPWVQRQIAVKPISKGNEPPSWGDCPTGKGPCGIAKEFGPSGPMECPKQEFLDDDDPASNRENPLLENLVTEVGGAGNPLTEYYEVNIGEGMHPAPESLKKVPGSEVTIPFLGYGAEDGKAADPTWPGPMFQARVGVPMVIRFINQTEDYMSVHLHGGHGPAHSDGHPAFMIPKLSEKVENYGQLPYGRNHRDYFYPHTIPAHHPDQRPTDEGRPNTQKPDDNLDYSESPSTLWYHDHSMDITGPHVGLGLAGFIPAFDDRELDLLKGGVLPFWSKENVADMSRDEVFEGQRHNPLDLCLALQDRCFSEEKDGRIDILYSVKGHDGHLGHRVMVNGRLYPRMRVIPRKYRVRMLNGSNARIYKLALFARIEDKGGKGGELIALRKHLPADRPEWFRIGIDTWLYPKPVRQRKILLAMAKRADTIVDFKSIESHAKIALGREPDLAKGERIAVYLCNLLDQENGRGPKVKLDDANDQELLAGANGLPIGIPSLQAVNTDDDGKAELAQPWPLMKFVIESDLDVLKTEKDSDGRDSLFKDMAELPKDSASVTFGTPLRQHVPIREEEVVRRREVVFERGNGIWQINGMVVDEFLSNFVPELNTAEEWILENGGGGWWHPIHIHLESHQQVEYLEELDEKEFKLVLGQIIATFDQAVKDEQALGNSDPSVGSVRLKELLQTLKNTLAPVQTELDEKRNLVRSSNDETTLQKLTKLTIQELEQFAKKREPNLPGTQTDDNKQAALLRLKKAYGGIGEMVHEFSPDVVFEDHRIWSRIPVQEWDRYKSDTTVLGPNTRVKIRMKFRTFDGPFVFHCHNLEHEDMRMMFVFDPRPTPKGVSDAADAALTEEAARQIRDEFHLSEQPVAYRHPWRFSDTPDFDKWAHEDTMPPCEKKPEWNIKPGTDSPPRAHPIWGGWDQHL